MQPMSPAPVSVAVIGCGHVGLVQAAGLASLGHRVVGVDRDRERVDRLTAGDIPFQEPGLRELVDGPFTEAKELVAGFWIWQVRSMDEAIEWLKRAPYDGGEFEVRQIFDQPTAS